MIYISGSNAGNPYNKILFYLYHQSLLYGLQPGNHKKINVKYTKFGEVFEIVIISRVRSCINFL